MSHHISSICRSAYLELRRISAIRPFLTISATATLACSRELSTFLLCLKKLTEYLGPKASGKSTFIRTALLLLCSQSSAKYSVNTKNLNQQAA